MQVKETRASWTLKTDGSCQSNLNAGEVDSLVLVQGTKRSSQVSEVYIGHVPNTVQHYSVLTAKRITTVQAILTKDCVRLYESPTEHPCV